MTNLARHIEKLLLEHECVVVPDFGGFITNHVNASMEEDEKCLLHPPYRTIRFNQALRANDGLLIQSYMTAFDVSYPVAWKQLKLEVDEVRDELDLRGEYLLGSLGLLRMDLTRHVHLITNPSGIVTPWLYGLTDFQLESVEALEYRREIEASMAQTSILPVVPAEEESEADERTLVVRLHRRWIDIAISAAAAVVLFFLFSYPAMKQPGETETYTASPVAAVQSDKNESRHVAEQPPVKKTMEQVAAADVVSESASAKQDDVAKIVSVPSYTIVLASYVTQANAEAYVKGLADAGFPDARFAMTGKVSRVLYATFTDEATASDALRNLRAQSNEFAEAWVMELKDYLVKSEE